MPNEMRKRVMFDTMAYQGLLEYQISFPLFIVSELWKFQMSEFFIGIRETVQKGDSDNLELSENSEFPVRWILGSELWWLALYIFFRDTWNHAWKTGLKVCVSVYEAHQVLRMCLK